MTNNPLYYKRKYRISSTRLPEWDYSAPGYYFVTICTHRFIRWFGEVKEGKMILSASGQIVEQELEKTTHIRESVSIDPWIIMPNHIHAIFIISNDPERIVETSRRGVSTAIRRWRAGTLGVIINQIKSKCTKRIHAEGYTNFSWQSRFYDHVIRDENALIAIHTYILGNPVKWEEDEYF